MESSVAAPTPKSRALLSSRQARLAMKIGLPVAGIVLFLAIWSATYRLSRYLVSPAEAARSIGELLTSREAWDDVIASFSRVAASLILSFVIGVGVALLMRTSDWLAKALSVYVFGGLSLPGLPVALFALMIFGNASQVGVILGVALIAFPFVVISLLDGLKASDIHLGQMGRVYGLSSSAKLKHIILPELTPYMFAALRNVYALAWKLVVFMEIFSQRVGIGAQYGRAYEFFNHEDLVAWLGLLLLGMFVVEYLALRPLEAHVLRWRQ